MAAAARLPDQLVDISPWFDANGESDKRLAYMRLTNALWEREKEDNRVRPVLEDAFYRYLDGRVPAEQIDKVRKLNDKWRSSSLLIAGYLLSLGVRQDGNDNYVDRAVIELSSRRNYRPPSTERKKDERQAIVDKRFSLLMEQLEEADDHKWKTTPDFVDMFHRYQVDSAIAARVYAYYRPIADEYAAAYNRKDEELVDAYSHLSREQQRTAIQWYLQLLATCKSFDSKKVAVLNPLRPSKREIKRAAEPEITQPKYGKQVNKKLVAPANLGGYKYTTRDPILDLTSAHPTQIIGAKAVVLWHSSRKLIQYIVAEERLQLKKQSIIGVDEQSSFRVKVRKPAIQVPSDGGHKEVLAKINKINATHKPATGRITADTMIIHVFR